MSRIPETRPCWSCGTAIYLLRNTSTDRWMPVEVAPSADGNITINLFQRTCQVLAGEPLHRAQVEYEDLHLPHHLTCPGRDHHRGPKDKTPPLSDPTTLEDSEEAVTDV